MSDIGTAASMTFPARPTPERLGSVLTSIRLISESYMFRALAIACLFIGLTFALIFLQPDPQMRLAQNDAEVTRASDGLDHSTVAPPVAAISQPQIAAPARPITAPVTQSVAPRPLTDPTMDLDSMTRSVLTQLGVPLPAPGATAQTDDAMRDMSMNALSGLRQMTGQPAASSASEDLGALIAKALMAGESDVYIDALLNEAAGRGEISVPRALVTSDGRVDTHVILSSIVAQAALASGQPVPPPPTPGGAGVEVRMVQQADKTVEHRFYTVNAGDSLGAIAVKFYGDVSRYNAIFDANRALLSSPDLLRVGQRLVIPTI